MSDPKEGPSPPTWKLMLVKWVGLFPPLVGIAYALNALSTSLLPPSLWFVNPDGSLVIWFKLLCTTALLVPLLNYVITPAMDSLFHGFLYAGIDEEKQRS